MATQQHPLEYVAVGMAGEVIDSGVVDASHPEALPVLPTKAGAVRLFRCALDAGVSPHKRLPFKREAALIVSLVTAGETLFKQGSIRKTGAGVHVFHLGKKSGVRELKTSHRFSDLLQSYWRTAHDDDVLVQVGSTNEELRTLMVQLVGAGDSTTFGRTVCEFLPLQSPAEPVRGALPPETAGAAARRQALLDTGWLDSAGVARELGNTASSNRSQFAANLRKQGKLLGVWVPEEKGFRHPLCQFHQHELLPVMADLLTILPKGNGSGWRQAEWLYSPHALLAKRTPAEVMATDPKAVLNAADKEYSGARHAGW